MLKDSYDELLWDVPRAVGSATSSKERSADFATYRSCSFVYGEIPWWTSRSPCARSRASGACRRMPAACSTTWAQAPASPRSRQHCSTRTWTKCCGIELLSGVHAVSVKLLERWREQVVDSPWLDEQGEESAFPAAKRSMEMRFINDDILSHDWSDGTALFANSVVYHSALMEKIAERASRCKIGTFFVTVAVELPNRSGKWELWDAQRCQMSYGPTTMYIQEKTS